MTTHDVLIARTKHLEIVNAVLFGALQEYIDYCAPTTEGEPTLIRIRERMRAALAFSKNGALAP